MLFIIAFVIIWAFFGFDHAFEAAQGRRGRLL